MLVMTFIPALISKKGELHYAEGFVYVLAGALVLALFFYFLEAKYIPLRRKRVMKKVIALFGSRMIDESTTVFKMHTLSIYSQLNFTLAVSEYHGYEEAIEFHIPREEVKSLPLRSGFRLKAGNCAGIETYLIYKGSSTQLKRARRKLETKVSELLGLPIVV